MPIPYISFGSNIVPEASIRRGMALLARTVYVRALSTLYRTQAFGRPDDPPFVNGVIEVDTALSPGKLKQALLEVETAMGRRRSSDKYAPRVLDLDIIWYDDIIDMAFVLPDPEIRHRSFLAVPLAELAPALALPDGTAIRDVAAGFGDTPMMPLPALTNLLRKDLEDEYQTRGRTDP